MEAGHHHIGTAAMATLTEPVRATVEVPTTYRAAVARAFAQPLSLEHVAAARLRAGQVRVRIEACGLCHTDIHAIRGDWPVKPALPFVPGHEGIGIVTEDGSSPST